MLYLKVLKNVIYALNIRDEKRITESFCESILWHELFERTKSAEIVRTFFPHEIPIR